MLWTAYGGQCWLIRATQEGTADSLQHLTVDKMGTEVLQSQGNEFCQHPVAWKRTEAQMRMQPEWAPWFWPSETLNRESSCSVTRFLIYRNYHTITGYFFEPLSCDDLLHSIRKWIHVYSILSAPSTSLWRWQVLLSPLSIEEIEAQID